MITSFINYFTETSTKIGKAQTRGTCLMNYSIGTAFKIRSFYLYFNALVHMVCLPSFLIELTITGISVHINIPRATDVSDRSCCENMEKNTLFYC